MLPVLTPPVKGSKVPKCEDGGVAGVSVILIMR